MIPSAAKAEFRQIQVFFLALLAGQILFAAVVLFLGQSGEETDAADESLFKTIIPIVTITTIFAAYFLQNRRQQEVTQLTDLHDKLYHYRQSFIISGAIVESGNLLAIVATLITGSTYYLLYFAIGLAAYLFFRPSLDKFSQVYNLRPEEIKTLEDKAL